MVDTNGIESIVDYFYANVEGQLVVVYGLSLGQLLQVG